MQTVLALIQIEINFIWKLKFESEPEWYNSIAIEYYSLYDDHCSRPVGPFSVNWEGGLKPTNN